MITGYVNSNLEAELTIQLIGPTGQLLILRSVIDTGYNGYLTLPISHVTSLGLQQFAFSDVTLGDNSQKAFDNYTADIEWDDVLLNIRVLCIEVDSLIGTALLEGYKLEADFVVGGQVALSKL